MKHILYLSIIAILGGLLYYTTSRLMDLKKGKGMYVANIGEMQLQMQNMVSRHIDTNLPSTYHKLLNDKIATGGIKVYVGESEISEMAFTRVVSGDSENPVVDFRFKTPVKVHGIEMGWISFNADDKNGHGKYFNRIEKPNTTSQGN
jgi:hypothetical protein